MRIVRVGLVNSEKNGGCEKAPSEIVKKLGEIMSNEAGKLVDLNLVDLEEIHVDINDLENTHNLVYENALEEFSEKDKVFFIGGDHSLSYSTVRAFRASFEKPFLIVFDAHGDCNLRGKNAHEEWLREIIEEGFPGSSVILISARNLAGPEISFLKENNVKLVSMKDIRDDTGGVCDVVMERALASEAVYISVDIDAVDPAFAPGTGVLEPGGLTSREIIYFLQRLALLKNFIAADVVDVDLDIDKRYDFVTCKLAAKLLSELF